MTMTAWEEELCAGVFAVPPFARRRDATRAPDFDQNDRIVKHIVSGGITRLLYGGNAFLYHFTRGDFEQLIDWLGALSPTVKAIPSLGPDFGVASDQAALLRNHGFPCAMMLPCADPRDAVGLGAGYREISARAGKPLIIYLKDESNFGPDKEAGLDVIAQLVGEGVCVAIKYAVVREQPAEDAYLEALLQRIDRRTVISGIGERPAVVHMRDWGLPGFTTGSGCVAPRLSQLLFEACVEHDYGRAQTLREDFLPLEDLRDLWGPARVLHSAAEIAGLAVTGAIPPYISGLTGAQQRQILPIAEKLRAQNESALAPQA